MFKENSFNGNSFGKNSEVILKGTGSININGKTIRGNNIHITDNDIYVDGKLQTIDNPTPNQENKRKLIVSIVIHGNAESVKCMNEKITINGDATQVKNMSGNVEVTDTVKGNVKNMSGNVTTDSIEGDVQTISGMVSKKSNQKRKFM